MSARTLLNLTISAILLAGIALGTLLPSGALPAAPGSDKMQHFGAFAGVALVITLLRRGSPLPVVLFLVLYGGLIELIQPLVGRQRELADFIADALGAISGSLAALLIRNAVAWLRRASPLTPPDTQRPERR